MNINFGNLTQDQTKEIFRRAMDELDLLAVAECLKAAFSADDRAELIAQLEDEIR
jgi:hypothetical protein